MGALLKPVRRGALECLALREISGTLPARFECKFHGKMLLLYFLTTDLSSLAQYSDIDTFQLIIRIIEITQNLSSTSSKLNIVTSQLFSEKNLINIENLCYTFKKLDHIG